MARVAYNQNDISLIARMMRAEAVGEGKLGMLMVGNVIVNRLKAGCLDFEELTSIEDVIYQVQGGNYSFEAVQEGDMFYNRARGTEKRLAEQVLKYWRQHPAQYALWYFNPYGDCPDTWFGEPFTGQYKEHCYYEPQPGTCESVYGW